MRTALILLGLAILVALAVLFDAASFKRALHYAVENPPGLLAAFGAYTLAFALRTLAWRPFVPRRVSILCLFRLLLGALFLNHATPAKAGDLARAYGLARAGIEAPRSIATVILARLADLLGLLAVLACSWTLAGGAEWGAVAVPLTAVAVLCVAVLARLERRLPLGPLRGPAARLQEALRQTRPGALCVAFLWAVPAWVLEAGILVFVLQSLGVEVPLSGAVAATCFAVLVTAAPLSPGGLGTYEAGMVFVLAGLGVPPGPAFAAAVLSHAVKFLYAFAAAPFAAYEGVIAIRRKDETRKVYPDEVRLKV